MLASPLLIQGKNRMRKRARTDLCGGRSAMVVPTATVTQLLPHGPWSGHNPGTRRLVDCEGRSRL